MRSLATHRVITNRDKIHKVIEKFFKSLYDKVTPENNPNYDHRAHPVECRGEETLPTIILPLEVEFALDHMKTYKEPGEDGILVELPRADVDLVLIMLVDIKGDCINLDNSKHTNFFAKVLCHRLTRQLNAHQLTE